MSDTDSIWVVSDIEGLDNVAIKTFSKFIEEMFEGISQLSKKEQKDQCLLRLAYLLSYRGKVDDIYKTLEWSEFSNTFVEYYCFRSLLFGIEMPIEYNIDERRIIQ